MKICNLASGSSGNCTYIETEKYKILIDLGKTKKYITEKLNSIGVDCKDIDYVFLTHTHDDHTSAIRTLLKNHKAKLVITQKMFMELKDIDNLNIIVYEDDPNIEGLDVKSYKMSHDTGDTRAFVITENSSSLVYITDTGYVNSRYFKSFKGKTAYFIESNHDVEMLTHGPYPEWLQKRVLSDVGHLSNKFAGMFACIALRRISKTKGNPRPKNRLTGSRRISLEQRLANVNIFMVSPPLQSLQMRFQSH